MGDATLWTSDVMPQSAGSECKVLGNSNPNTSVLVKAFLVPVCMICWGKTRVKAVKHFVTGGKLLLVVTHSGKCAS